MKKYLLPQQGNFYKANLHMHTVVSDGSMTPQEVKEAYMEKGYSIVAFTDHEVLVPHNDLTDDNFLAITSYEAAVNCYPNPDLGFATVRCYHLNLYSFDKDKDVSSVFDERMVWNQSPYVSEGQKGITFNREYSVESVNELISKANAEGFLVSYNHPNWSLQSYKDYAGLKGLWGVEVWNTGCVNEGYFDNVQSFDDLLMLGNKIYPLATDDAHSSRANPHDCFGGWVTVKAERLEYSTVMEALKNGDFYASSGPEIKELYLEDGKLHIKTSPASKIEVITERRVRYINRTPNTTEAEFDINWFLENSEKALEEYPPFFRITVTDENGYQAFTRAFFKEDWKQD